MKNSVPEVLGLLPIPGATRLPIDVNMGDSFKGSDGLLSVPRRFFGLCKMVPNFREFSLDYKHVMMRKVSLDGTSREIMSCARDALGRMQFCLGPAHVIAFVRQVRLQTRSLVWSGFSFYTLKIQKVTTGTPFRQKVYLPYLCLLPSNRLRQNYRLKR